jgi:hypothetical protein
MPRKLDVSFQRTLGDGPSSAAFNSSVGPTQVVKRRHRTPEWFANDNQVAEFIRARFPWANKSDGTCECRRCTIPVTYISAAGCKCRPCRETMMAAKWFIVIRYWFVAHWNDSKIEQLYEWKSGECGSIVQKIRRALRGDRLDGRRRTGRSRGRPKMVSQV